MDAVHLPFKRILLTGFRATGKSLVGKLLAERLRMEFLDTDEILCSQLDCCVADYVVQCGWDRFRRLEQALLQKLCEKSGVVIAAGGGAVLHEQAWQSLCHDSVSVWLRADERTIENRLSTDEHSPQQRPSLTGKDPRREVRELLAERVPLYLKGSDFAIRTDGRIPRELVDEIEQHLVVLAENYRTG